MKKKRFIKKIGCCLLVGAMVFSSIDVSSLHAKAGVLPLENISTPTSAETKQANVNGVYWTYTYYKGYEWVGPYAYNYDKVEYVTNLRLTDPEKVTLKNITVPSEIQGCKVIEIGTSAFENCDAVETVEIPGTITRICDKAFYGCDKLRTVNIRNSNKEINYGANLEAVGDYVFAKCTALTDVVLSENLLKDGILGNYTYDGCIGLKSVSFNGKNITIPEGTFKDCINLDTVSFDKETEKVVFGDFSFKNCSFKELTFDYPTIFGTQCFAYNSYLKAITFNNEFSLTEKYTGYQKSPFMGSFMEDVSEGKKTVTFNTDTVNLSSKMFIDCTGLTDVIFTDKVSKAIFGYKPFYNAGVSNFDFQCKDVVIEEGGLEGLINAKEINFNNTGSTTLQGSVFYSSYIADYRQLNKVTKEINFNCNSVYYVSNAADSSLSTVSYNIYAGLKADGNKNITYKENVKLVRGNISEDGISTISNVYVESPKTDYNVSVPDIAYNLYGYNNTVYANNKSKTKTKFYNIQEDNLLLVSYRGDEVVITQGIVDEKLTVTSKLVNGTILQPSRSKDDNSYNGYTIQYMNDLQEGNTQAAIKYGDKTTLLQIKIIPRAVIGFEVIFVGSEKIEGQTLNSSDFKISNINFNDDTMEETTNEDIKVELVGSEKLVKGKNTVNITYKGKTIPYILEAKAKKVNKLDIKWADETKFYYEGAVLSNTDFKVTAHYDNGDIAENFTDYTLENTTVRKDITNVTFVCSDYTQTYEYQGIPLKIDHLNVSYNGREVIENGLVDKADLTVTAVYNSGKEVILKQDEYNFKSYTIIGGTVNTVFVVYNADATVPEVPFNVTGVKAATEVPIESATPTPVPAESATPAPTESATPTPAPTESATPTPVPTESATPTPVPTESATPTPIPTKKATPVPTKNATQKPVQTVKPIIVPNAKPTVLALKKSKYTVGVKERVTVKVSKGAAKSFTSSNKKVATVNAKGVVTAKKTGMVKITVKGRDGSKKICTIVVKKAPKAIKASFTKKIMQVKKKVTVRPKFIKGYYSNKITYTSSNKKVATVSSTGVITAKKKGKTTITLKTYNGRKVKVSIIVK